MAPPPGSYSWAAVRMGVVQGIDYLEQRMSADKLSEAKSRAEKRKLTHPKPAKS